MTADRKELTIAGVTILEYRQFQETRQIAEVIPTAHSAYNGERPRSFARSEATLVSYAAGPDPFTLARHAERDIDLCRAKAGTWALSWYFPTATSLLCGTR